MTANRQYKQATRATWDANPAGWSHAPDQQIGSKAFFERARLARLNDEIPFIKELIPWDTVADKRVLEIGCGAGFDAYMFCERGARYTGIDYASRNPARARDHLAHFGYHPPVMRSDGERLPFDDGVFDVVFSNGVLHHTPDMPEAFCEALRVLRPGGTFWVVLYHKHSAYFWLSVVVFDYLIKGGFLRRSLARQLSRIEQTGADEGVLVNVYSRGQLRRLLDQSGFELQGMWVRKLPGRDLPGYRLLKYFYRFAPRSVARWFETRWGWYLTAQAVRHDD